MFSVFEDINAVRHERWHHTYDKQNRNGGSFSDKVISKTVPNVWSELMYTLCGHTLTISKKHMDLVTGKNLCVIKIWLSDCSLQDPALIFPIENLSKMGCILIYLPEY